MLKLSLTSPTLTELKHWVSVEGQRGVTLVSPWMLAVGIVEPRNQAEGALEEASAFLSVADEQLH